MSDVRGRGKATTSLPELRESGAAVVVATLLARGGPEQKPKEGFLRTDLDFAGKTAVFETFRKLHPILKEQHFLNPKEEEDDPYESTQITALIANASGIFGVYSMREVFEYTQFWAVGSGREFALGAMYGLYGRMRTATAVATAAIEAGATFDKNSALPMTLYTLTLKEQ